MTCSLWAPCWWHLVKGLVPTEVQQMPLDKSTIISSGIDKRCLYQLAHVDQQQNNEHVWWKCYSLFNNLKVFSCCAITSKSHQCAMWTIRVYNLWLVCHTEHTNQFRFTRKSSKFFIWILLIHAEGILTLTCIKISTLLPHWMIWNQKSTHSKKLPSPGPEWTPWLQWLNSDPRTWKILEQWLLTWDVRPTRGKLFFKGGHWDRLTKSM